jgi:hypothetical protein
MLAILFVQHKLFLDGHTQAEVFEVCPPDGWTSMNAEQKGQQIK